MWHVQAAPEVMLILTVAHVLKDILMTLLQVAAKLRAQLITMSQLMDLQHA